MSWLIRAGCKEDPVQVSESAEQENSPFQSHHVFCHREEASVLCEKITLLRPTVLFFHLMRENKIGRKDRPCQDVSIFL
jgi:hypothetical protein